MECRARGLRKSGYRDCRKIGDRWERSPWKVMDEVRVVVVVRHGRGRMLLEVGVRHGQCLVRHMAGHGSLCEQRLGRRDHPGAEWEQTR